MTDETKVTPDQCPFCHGGHCAECGGAGLVGLMIKENARRERVLSKVLGDEPVEEQTMPSKDEVLKAFIEKVDEIESRIEYSRFFDARGPYDGGVEGYFRELQSITKTWLMCGELWPGGAYGDPDNYPSSNGVLWEYGQEATEEDYELADEYCHRLVHLGREAVFQMRRIMNKEAPDSDAVEEMAKRSWRTDALEKRVEFLEGLLKEQRDDAKSEEE